MGLLGLAIISINLARESIPIHRYGPMDIQCKTLDHSEPNKQTETNDHVTFDRCHDRDLRDRATVAKQFVPELTKGAWKIVEILQTL